MNDGTGVGLCYQMARVRHGRESLVAARRQPSISLVNVYVGRDSLGLRELSEWGPSPWDLHFGRG